MGRIFIIKGFNYSPPSSGDGQMSGSVVIDGKILPYFTYYFFQPLATNYLSYTEGYNQTEFNRIKAIYDLSALPVTTLKVDISKFEGYSFRLLCLDFVPPRTTGVKNSALETDNTILNYTNGQWVNCDDDVWLEIPAGTKSLLFSIAGPSGSSSYYFTPQQLDTLTDLFAQSVHIS